MIPVFHPNIAPHAICVGDHLGAGDSLQSIVARIGEMLAYQSYTVESPLNGEAARRVEEDKELLPLDRVRLHAVDERPAAKISTSAPAVKPTPPAVPLNSSAAAIARTEAPPLTMAQRLAAESAAPPAAAICLRSSASIAARYQVGQENSGGVFAAAGANKSSSRANQ